MERAAFRGAVGINDFWPFGGPQADTAANGQIRFRPAPNTFLFAEAPFSQHVNPRVQAMLIDAGFDHIRVQYHPGPWMQAIAQNDRGFLEYMFGHLDDCVNSLVNAGLGVNLSAIPTGYANLYSINTILGGLGNADYELYKRHLVAFADRYRKYDPRTLMIELINEPPGNGTQTVRASPNWDPQYTGDWQTQYQPDLYKFMRHLMPEHTLGLTSDGWSNWETLCQMDTTLYRQDKNIIWGFHPIFPVPAAQQGFIYNQYQYIERLHYPPGAGGQTRDSAIATMTARVNADPSLNAQQKAGTIAGLTGDLHYYFDTPQDYAWVKECHRRVAVWADTNNISRANVMSGEYGMVRDNTGFPGNVLGSARGYLGGTRLDRIHLYRDCKRASFEYGFRHAPDHLDTNDYGITTGQNNQIGVFDPLILDALSPKRLILGYGL